LQSGRLGRQTLPVSIKYRYTDTQASVSFRNLRIAGGRVAVSASYRDSGWSADIDSTGLQPAALLKELQAAGIALPPLTLDGTLDLNASLRGKATGLTVADFVAQVRAGNFTDESGRYAGENLHASVKGSARHRSYGWDVQSDLTVKQGAVYIDPVYVEAGSEPIVADAAISWRPRQRRLDLHSFNYHHPSSVDLTGQGQVDLSAGQPVRQLQLEIHKATFPVVYENYLKPWVEGTLAGNLETAGGLQGRLQIENGAFVRASADLRDMTLRERDGLFGFDKLSGDLDWSASESPEYSTLGWESGHVYRVGLGQSRLELESTGNAVRLVKPVRIPVLDGALDIESFSLDYPADKPMRWDVDGILTPVSMKQLTLALKWPEFGGKLSGVIPSVMYDNGELSVGGVLLVRVFDGVVTLRDLRLNEPFGLVPRLQVNARADNIDLEPLTGTFSFGRIEGRLDGRVDGLRLESWRPVAFDAEFLTPAGDKSRHRISQKAVDNISNIGGAGMGGALSRSFLRFLEDFPYDRLGIRCRLQNGVCDMGGVEAVGNGYYLVKGTFLPPRLDVVGYANRVDWDTLVAQIIAVTRQQDVVVE
jgi:hypothetical protein